MSDASSTAPIINITGNTVALGPFPETMLEALHRWNNDFAIEVLDGSIPYPQRLDSAQGEIDRLSRSEMKRSDFAIYELATMRLIGLVNLRDINYWHRTAEMGILIGEQDCWGKGYGTETLYLLLDYAFSMLGLHNVMLSTVGYNERALRTYRRVGFREIGRRREVCPVGTKLYDAVFMDCLSTEFHSPLPPIVTPP